jgi:hypothetical protein
MRKWMSSEQNAHNTYAYGKCKKAGYKGKYCSLDLRNEEG